MADNQLSYDFDVKIRDVQNAYNILVSQYPTLLSRIPIGEPALSTKIEWLEEQMTPTEYTIASFDTNGDGTGVNLVSTAGISAGDILVFFGANGEYKTERAKVTSVDSGTDLTIERDYGSTTGVTLVVGWKARVLKPVDEATSATVSAGYEPSVAYNFTQIFQRAVKVSRTATQSAMYGINPTANASRLMLYQMNAKMTELMWEMNDALIYGVRKERSSSEKGTTSGLFAYLQGGNVNTTGGAISSDHINDVFELIYNDGGRGNNLALLMNVNQARKISGFNSGGTNPLVVVQQGSGVTGGSINRFIADFTTPESGYNATVIVEPNMPKDTIAVVNLDQIAVRYLQTMVDKDATTSEADDFFARRLLAELAFEIRNGQKAHGLITGLTV